MYTFSLTLKIESGPIFFHFFETGGMLAQRDLALGKCLARVVVRAATQT